MNDVVTEICESLCELFCRHRFCVGLRRLKNEHSQHAAVFSIILMASLVHNNWFRCDITDLHSIFSASLPQAQLFCHNTRSRTPCNFRTITFPLTLETECVFPAQVFVQLVKSEDWSNALFLQRVECRVNSLMKMFPQNTFRHTQEIEMYLHMLIYTRHAKGSVCSTLEQSLIQGHRGRGGEKNEGSGFHWIHWIWMTSWRLNYTHPQLSHFRRAFTLNWKHSTKPPGSMWEF